MINKLRKLDLAISFVLLTAAAVASVALAILVTPKVLFVTIPAYVVAYALWEGFLFAVGFVEVSRRQSTSAITSAMYSVQHAILHPEDFEDDKEVTDDEYYDEGHDEENIDEDEDDDLEDNEESSWL